MSSMLFYNFQIQQTDMLQNRQLLLPVLTLLLRTLFVNLHLMDRHLLMLQKIARLQNKLC